MDIMIESDLYLPIKKDIYQTLKEAGCEGLHIEITANNSFSNLLRKKFGEVLSLLDKSFSPDLSGLYHKNGEKKIILEVKKEKITIQNIYQTISYQELIDADIGLLVSPEEIPLQIKKFLNKHQRILQDKKRNIFIIKFDKIGEKILESSWYPFQPSF